MTKKSSQYNPLDLLAKALEHPSGQELVSMIYRMHQDTRPKAQLNSPDARLVAIAIDVSKSKNLKPKEIPYFKEMTNDQIQQWIAQHS
ncbi:MAG TPA: hypothetical protein V6C85_14455 [Allocoleopsis sp.]